MQFNCFGDLYILPWTSTSEQIITEIPNTNNYQYYFPWLKWTLPPVLDWCLTSLKKNTLQNKISRVNASFMHQGHNQVSHGLLSSSAWFKSHLIDLWLPATFKGTIIFLQSWAIETPGKHTLPEHSQLHFCLIVIIMMMTIMMTGLIFMIFHNDEPSPVLKARVVTSLFNIWLLSKNAKCSWRWWWWWRGWGHVHLWNWFTHSIVQSTWSNLMLMYVRRQDLMWHVHNFFIARRRRLRLSADFIVWRRSTFGDGIWNLITRLFFYL